MVGFIQMEQLTGPINVLAPMIIVLAVENRGATAKRKGEIAISEEKEKKEPISQKEFFDGCAGCFSWGSLGCLPFSAIILFVIKLIF